MQVRLSKDEYKDLTIKSYGIEFKAATPQPDGSMLIEGWASTNTLDRDNEVVEPQAFASSLNNYLANPIVLFMHQWTSLPIGKCVEALIKPEGLWIKCLILPTATGKDVIMLIQNGVIKSFSIGFAIKKFQTDQVTGITTILDLELYEISVVNIPANPMAVFSEAQAKQLTLKSLTMPDKEDGKNRKGTAMGMDLETKTALQKVEDLVGNLTPAIEKANTQIQQLTKNMNDQARLLKQLQEQADKVTAGLITPQEFKTQNDKFAEEILKLSGEIEKGKAAKQLRNEPRVIAKDWRSYIKDFVFLRDDLGNPLPKIYQKAYALFQQPVDYDKSDDGHLIKMIRDMHDTVVINMAYQRGKNGHVDPTRLKSWDYLRQLVNHYDPEFAKAMYSTGTGLGDEWVPTLMSSELYDLIRLEPSIERYIPSFEMPSNPFEWPIKTSGVTIYRADEATSNNPPEYTKTDLGTSKITFTAETLVGVVKISTQAIEDAIIDMVSEIRAEFAYGINYGCEDAIINGDDSATHFDTGLSLTSTSTDVRCSWKGLRKLAVAASKAFDVKSASPGVGDGTTAFVAADVRYLNKLMDVCAIDPTQVVYPVSSAAYYALQNLTALASAADLGAAIPNTTGTLKQFNGSEIYISPVMRADLAATGLYTGSGATTAMLGVYKRGFKVGNKRAVTIDFVKEPYTGQWGFVATLRKDFQKMTPSTRYPVAYAYNI